MKQKLFLGIAVFAAALTINSSAQTTGGVSISEFNDAPHAKAMLHVKSTSKGTLITRMTISQRDAITPGSGTGENSADGLMVYVIDSGADNGYWYWDGSSSIWKRVGGNDLWQQNSTTNIYYPGKVAINTTSMQFTTVLTVNGRGAISKGIDIGSTAFVNDEWGLSVTAVNSGDPTSGIVSIASKLDGGNKAVAGYFSAHSNDPNGINYGISTHATLGAATNYAIYAQASGGSTNYAGYFQGNVTVIGTFSNPSDSTMKKNISDINNALAIVNQLKPKKYKFKKEAYPQMNFSARDAYGLLAQDVETVMPSIVNNEINPAQYDKNGNLISAAVQYKSISYIDLIPVLIQAIKEQQAIINQMEQRIKALEK